MQYEGSMTLNASQLTSPLPIWWNSDPYLGLFFFLLGVCGAAITVYLYIGNFEKLIGKSTDCLNIEKDILSKKNEIENLKDKLKSHECRMQLENLIKDKEGLLIKEKNGIKIQGAILYLFIGGILASIIAKGIIDAVAIGAAWTTVLGVFGIKKEVQELKSVKDEEITISESDYDNITAELNQTLDALDSAYIQLDDASETIKNNEDYIKDLEQLIDKREKQIDHEKIDVYWSALIAAAAVQDMDVNELFKKIKELENEAET